MEVTAAGLIVLRSERPKFNQLLFYLSRRCFKGVIIYCWDRGCRNDSDEVAIKRLIRDGVDIRFVTTTYENNSSGALHMDVEGMFAKHHSRLTSEKVTATTKQLRARGICTYRAPVGYLNQKRADRKPFDPTRAPLIKELFERYATGAWTLMALERWARDVGLTMPPMRRPRSELEMLADEDDEGDTRPKIARPLTFNSIHKVLRNRFYAGYVKGPLPGEWIKSCSHDALISDALFDEVQAKLGEKQVSLHYQTTLDRPYRKMLRCAECNRVFTPYRKKGHIYLGARCRTDCANPRRNLSAAQLESEIAGVLGGLSFTEAEITEFSQRLSTDVQRLTNQQQQTLEDVERRKRRLRDDLKYLRDQKLPLLKSGVYSVEEYQAEETKLTVDLRAWKDKEDISDEALTATMLEVAKVSELLNSVAKRYILANSTQKEEIARIVFSELRVGGNSLTFSLTTGMKPFAARLVTICDPKEWVSELLTIRGDMKAVAYGLERLMKN